MPTNILRQNTKPKHDRRPPPPASPHTIVFAARKFSIRARLAANATADRLWAALPLHTTVETWGKSVLLEVPVESGRERGARVLGRIGEIYHCAEDDRIVIAFGPTPISRPGEIRLPRPCTLLATTEDDLTGLAFIMPGEKISILRGEAAGNPCT